ncbi:unnamed protein product, partial [marine sediment metagenome]
PWTGLNASLGTFENESLNYDYKVEVPHFSILLITEPYFCGNEEFDPVEEVCDGSVAGVTNCLSDCTACEDDFEVNESGFCLEIDVGTECFEEGDTKCRGYTFYECDDDLEWERQGIIIGECKVKCEKANTSCQGEYSILCGSNYKWAIQGKIDGLCGYVSPTGGTLLLGDTILDDDDLDSEEDDERESQTFIIFLIVAIFLLVILVIFVLFKIFSREKRKPGLTTSTHYPARPRSRRPPVQRRYPTRRYPV